jgi:hypothetical protein
MKYSPADELARVASAEAGQAKMLRRSLAELERLPASSTTAEPKPLGPATRLEAALIEKRIERNARREVRASQLDPSQVIYSTLGAFPANDPEKAVAWDDGAHAIATYRHRHGIHDEATHSTDSLGDLQRERSGCEFSGAWRTRNGALEKLPIEARCAPPAKLPGSAVISS